MRIMSNGRVNESSAIRCFKQVFESINGKVRRMTLYTDNVEEATGVVIPCFSGSIIIGGVSTEVVKQILEKAFTNGAVDLDAFKLTLLTKKKDIKAGVSYLIYEDLSFEGDKVSFFYRDKDSCFNSPFSIPSSEDDEDDFEED